MASDEARALDWQVAERVFGATLCTDAIDLMGRPCLCWHVDGKSRWQDYLPAFSTDIAAAFEVVERMRECHQMRFKLWEQIGDDYQEPSLRWMARFGARGVAGATIPEAICRAALAALEARND